MTWDDLDWSALERFRELFLRGGPAAGPYWNSPGDLASYDFTYAERIGWKWDQVLRELRLRGWRPSTRTVPRLGSIAPMIMCSAVDLPAPVRPTSATISPRATVKERSRTAA